MKKTFGTPLKPSSIKIMLLGSGELGKEVAIEAMRFGVEVIACDRYAAAPAMLVANSAHVFNMRDGKQVRRIVEKVQPDFIVPEIEAIATDTLVELEKEGWTVIPTARAAQLTMDRRGIRKLALSLCRKPRRTARRRRGGGLSLLHQAHHVVVRTRPKRRAQARRHRKELEDRDGGHARQHRAGDRRGRHRLRL